MCVCSVVCVIYIHVHMCVRARLRVHVSVYVCMHARCVCVYIHIRTYTCLCMSACMQMCMYAYVYTKKYRAWNVLIKPVRKGTGVSGCTPCLVQEAHRRQSRQPAKRVAAGRVCTYYRGLRNYWDRA